MEFSVASLLPEDATNNASNDDNTNDDSDDESW
jgi:hypothetical protein